RVLDAGRAEEGAQAYAEAIAIGEKLVSESPTVHYFRSRLGTTYKLLADVLRNTGKLPEAEKRYRQSITVFEKLVDDIPNMNFGGSLDDAYSGLSALLRITGRLEEESRLFQTRIADLSKAIDRNAQTDTDRKLGYLLRLAQCYRHLADLFVLQGKAAESA